MSSGAWLLVAWTITFAAWLLTHVVATVNVLRDPEAPVRWRALALVPIATPYVAWRYRKRVSASLWIVFAALYVMLRFFG